MNIVGAGMWAQWLHWLDRQSDQRAYARLRLKPNAQDDTLALQSLFESGRVSTHAAETAFRRISCRIRASRIIFVPGFNAAAPIFARDGTSEFLAQQVRLLKDEGFDAEIASIDATVDIAGRGDQIATILAQHHRPSWIISHSIGGLDTLHALLTSPGITRFVDGWIAFQSPFFGSPIADLTNANDPTRKLIAAAFRFLGIRPEALKELNTGERGKFMDRFAVQLAKLSAEFPLMCVGSSVNSWRSAASGWMKHHGMENDGLVPLNSVILPSAHFVKLKNLAHGEVAPRQHGRRSTGYLDLLKCLFSILLSDCGKPQMRAA